ncbi:MAG: hypothetical protein ACRDNW_19795 [Trebonia sp.]
MIQPFDYRTAAHFWGITDPRLALLTHTVVGGTPAYGREFIAGDAPSNVDDFDDWVVRTALNPQLPLFREARYLLAEESQVREPALYHGVLAAIAEGHSAGRRWRPRFALTCQGENGGSARECRGAGADWTRGKGRAGER